MTGAACGGGLGTPDGGGAGGADPNRWRGAVKPSINRNVDILFMVDDSSSMDLQQANLIRNFPTFMARPQDPPGLPNVQIAVVSQDMGAAYGSITGSGGLGCY